ncbi:stage II sporulation protein M [Schaalia sp. 19OD2882]|uniref:stage II sporulation protein M n=1 Tax=Schaalia sp. 19OD2882 TaxID=2794089 RepID=UPI001C1ED965|nr:stage II sporulation protein M [Schaalia sp. 19OD2882]QWW20301.1 stage II sporulation protein M [Schaalia sp. 19OD2882]
MDIDALRAARGPAWARLHTLASGGTLDGATTDELARLYRQGTGDLAAVRALNPDADAIRSLSGDLARARARLTGVSGISGAAVSAWFRIVLPAALYRIRWWIFGVMMAFLAIALLQAWWLLRDPSLFQLLGTESQLRHYATRDFVAYYSQDTNAEFAVSVWVNNAWIAAQCIGAGITGLYPIAVLYNNALGVGVSGAIVYQYAGAWQFFRFILPHGLPELTAIFIAGAAGLRTFWSVIVPGPLTRMESFARTGRAMVTVAGGTTILLFLSGLIEGFVTPSELPAAVEIGAGTLLTALVWVYILLVGGRAVKAGHTGDLEEDAGWSQPVAG